ncbi:MAG TPA: C-type lectin domain-containing protein, partial [Dongiaceae bacterium]|nr:C-type lectin domain-containing protein [Dongiaceae bacterium]
HTTAQTWMNAQTTCMSEMGHLVTILSDAEDSFVGGMAPFAGQFNDIWIGATDGRANNDTNGPGTYRWVTTEPFNYHPWAPGQPDGFCDPCQMPMTCTCDHRATLASDATWSDWFGDNPRNFVCESP